MHKLSRLGVEVDLPDGWDGRIYDRREEASGELRRGLHAANFPLPTNLGDFGASAIHRMLDDDVLVVLLEYPGSAGSALFSNQGLPALRPESFTPGAMPQAIPGRAGAQFFFSVGDRAFSLFIVIGNHARKAALAPVANAVVRTLKLS